MAGPAEGLVSMVTSWVFIFCVAQWLPTHDIVQDLKGVVWLFPGGLQQQGEASSQPLLSHSAAVQDATKYAYWNLRRYRPYFDIDTNVSILVHQHGFQGMTHCKINAFQVTDAVIFYMRVCDVHACACMDHCS